MKTYRDLFGWLDPVNAVMLPRLIEEYEIHTVLEIGSFMGKSAALFASCPVVGEVWCVDPFFEADPTVHINSNTSTIQDLGLGNPFYQDFVRSVRSVPGAWDKIIPVTLCAKDALAYVPDVDLVYVDGGHLYANVKQDLQLYSSKAKKIFCGDDCKDAFPGVQQAVKECVPNANIKEPFWWVVR